ncbi:hypothetical protein MUK42_29876 [Musa troglodytarum]|uniref:Uncharacterized protein n=1 Tax=Musa troglodytarum TaxID=320322 RepID=A0A9E7JWD0_9LILI|nr:hypothetical protein MUK42_29876 [Musa troglodytarum]
METETAHEVKPGQKETRPLNKGKKTDVLIGWSAGHEQLKTLYGGETGFLCADAVQHGLYSLFHLIYSLLILKRKNPNDM